MKPEHQSPEDERLRSRFQELRRDDQRGAPSFEKMRAGRRPVRSPWRVIVPAASLAAAAMFVLWCGAGTMLESASAPQAAAPAAPAAAPAVAAGGAAFDPAPLDFLLDVPGSAPRSVRTSFDSNPLQGW